MIIDYLDSVIIEFLDSVIKLLFSFSKSRLSVLIHKNGQQSVDAMEIFFIVALFYRNNTNLTHLFSALGLLSWNKRYEQHGRQVELLDQFKIIEKEKDVCGALNELDNVFK